MNSKSSKPPRKILSSWLLSSRLLRRMPRLMEKEIPPARFKT